MSEETAEPQARAWANVHLYDEDPKSLSDAALRQNALLQAALAQDLKYDRYLSDGGYMDMSIEGDALKVAEALRVAGRKAYSYPVDVEYGDELTAAIFMPMREVDEVEYDHI